MVPSSESDSTALVQQFFACLAALMSTQLRGLVINSLADFLSFLSLYKVITLVKRLSSTYDDYLKLEAQKLLIVLDKLVK